jgi:hypothetical protein
MQIVHPVCCGTDGHAVPLTACLRRVRDDGQSRTEWRDFGIMYDQLWTLRAWLAEQGCPIAVLERTGVYWNPISHAWWQRWKLSSPMPARYAGGQGKRPTNARGAGADAHPKAKLHQQQGITSHIKGNRVLNAQTPRPSPAPDGHRTPPVCPSFFSGVCASLARLPPRLR